MLRILKDQAIEHSMPPGRRKQRKGIVHPNRSLAAIQQFAKISLAMPAFRVGGGLEAVILDPPVPRIESLDSIGTSVSALAEPICDKKPVPGGGAFDHGSRFQSSHALHGGSLALFDWRRVVADANRSEVITTAWRPNLDEKTPDSCLVRIVTQSYADRRTISNMLSRICKDRPT